MVSLYIFLTMYCFFYIVMNASDLFLFGSTPGVAPKTSSSSDVPPMISSSSFEVLSETRSSSEVHPHTFSSSSAFVAPAGNETVSDADDIDVDLTADPEGFESDDLDSILNMNIRVVGKNGTKKPTFVTLSVLNV